MHVTMSTSAMLTLFTTMFVLACIPGVSVLTVSARSAAHGFQHGLMVTAGIVVGDIVYILVAVYGLSILADTLDDRFLLVKYLGARYLLWLGVGLWRSVADRDTVDRSRKTTLLASFAAGLVITLADQKAILFYLGLFPSLINLTLITAADTMLIIAIASLAVGSAKLLYAYLAARGSSLSSGAGFERGIRAAAGGLLIALAIYILLRP